jgi:hypothetical protein
MSIKFEAYPVVMLSMLPVWTNGYSGGNRAVQYVRPFTREAQIWSEAKY